MTKQKTLLANSLHREMLDLVQKYSPELDPLGVSLAIAATLAAVAKEASGNRADQTDYVELTYNKSMTLLDQKRLSLKEHNRMLDELRT